MRTVKISALVAAAAAILWAGCAFAQDKPTRAADWERKASQWAVKAYAKALAAHKDAAEKNRQALAARKGTPLPADIVKANSDRGFVVFRPPYEGSVRRRMYPPAEQTRFDGLSAVAARGEWEGVKLGVWALKDIPELTFTVSDLVHANGAGRISAADNVRGLFGFNLWTPLRTARVVRPDGDIVVGEKVEYKQTFNEMPSALVDLPSMKLTAGEGLAIWIDIHVPRDAAAGRYTGKVVLKAGSGQAAVPLTLTVRPFVLDAVDDWGRGAFISKHRTRAELIQMREYGMNMISWWTSASYTLKLVDGKIVAKFPAYQKYAKLLDECGYVRRGVVFLGASDPKIQNRIFEILKRPTIGNARDQSAGPAFAKSDISAPFGEYLCQAMRQFHEQMKAVGWGEFSACLLDEPDHRPRPQRRNWYIKMFAMVEKGAPKVPLYGTFYHLGDEDRLSHHHKMWTTNRPAKRIAEKCKAAGQNLWTYHGGFGYTSSPGGRRFRLGITPWVYGASGTYFWANYWNNGDPFDPWSIRGSLATVSLKTPHGPLATPILKGIREGIDDGRYLRMLDRLIAKAQAAGGPAALEAAAARRFLDSFRKPVYEKMGVRGGRPNFSRVGKITVTGADGTTAVLDRGASTWKFARFVRKEAAGRIQAILAKLK